MTTVRRLTLVGVFFALAALLTSTHVWGDSGDKKDAPLGRPDPEKVGRLGEDLALTKFSKKPVVTYKTEAGDTLFGLQVKPKLDATSARPRDVVLVVDTSASQFGAPLANAKELAAAIIAAAGKEDRVAIWTANVPAATKNLTDGFKGTKTEAVKTALEKLGQEIPLGAVDLKNALNKAYGTFDLNREGRQRAIVFLGNGMSIADPVDNKDRVQLCEKLVGHEIAFFPIPLGPRTQLERGSPNLHGFATGTGGLVVRHSADAEFADTAKTMNEALASPILYPKAGKFTMPAEAAEFFPTKLPPLRIDAPTLVVGKMKPTDKFTYAVEGTVNGKDVKVRMTEDVTPAEVDNFFLVSLVGQWQKADKDAPAMIRADRALALAFEQNRLARDELLAQAQWAMADNNLAVADDLFGRARKMDPSDPDAEAGQRIVDKLRTGALTKEKLKAALSKPTDQGMKIEKGKLVRGQMGDLVAQADPKEKAPERIAPGPDAPAAQRDEFLRQEKARLAIEEQRITGIVADAERQARRLLSTDPDAAHDLLKRTLASIRENPDLSPKVRQDLATRLTAALTTVDTQGARIKQDLDQRLRAMADAQRRLALEAERVRGEELIRAKMQAFNGLMNQGRFEEAYKEALVMQQSALDRGAPIAPAMTAAYTMAETAYNVREVQEVRRASEERFLLTMLQVDKSHIPFPDEPPVQFPPAATWRVLSDRRKNLYDSFGLGEEDPRVALKLSSRLSEPVNLPEGIPANSTVKDALDFLSDKYHLTFVIDTNAFQAIEVQKVEEQNVTLPKMIGVSLSTVLRLLLGQIKGQRYTGTYIIRRDYIEITTTYNAAAEKTVRAYPVADLVIPIPNGINEQALALNQRVYAQYQQSQNPFQFGNQFGFPGAFPGVGAPAPAPGIFNPANQPGFNQFGNLGGQFGIQGAEKSYELLQLVTKVVAPGEWQPLGPNPNAQPAPPGFGPGPLPIAAQPPEDPPLVDRPLLNGIDYYQPARALIVRGSTRIHTRIGGGLVGPNPMGGPPAMGRIDGKPVDALVIAPKDPKDPKDPKVVVGGDGGKKDPKKPIIAEVDAKKVWTDALAKIQNDPKADHVGLVIATADALVQNSKFDHAAEFLKANLRLGIVSRPWVYEALALSLQLSNASTEEIERAQISAIDVEPTDAQGYLRAAKAMVELKRTDRAVALCKQAALMQPNAPEAYANAMVYAEVGKDGDAMAWAAGNLLQRDWPMDNDFLHGQAHQGLDGLAKVLEKDRKADAERMLKAANEVRVRDLVIHLSWTCEPGEADLDLKVKEPINTVCSFLQRQTPGGGTLLGDSVTDGSREFYIAAEAFTGDYDVTVEWVRGRTLGGKATVEVIKHQGTKDESRERFTVSADKDGKATLKVKLADGRRTTVATVPTTSPRAERIVDDPASGDRVLNKLRAMTDPMLRESGFKGSTGSNSAQARLETRPVAPRVPEKPDFTTKVPTGIGNGADIMGQQVIDPKTGKVGLRLNPVFQTVGGRPQGTLVNPLIPGGF